MTSSCHEKLSDSIDLGKFKSVLCVMDVATRTHQFATIDSTPETVAKAVRQYVSTDPAQTQVVFETCDRFAVPRHQPRWEWDRLKKARPVALTEDVVRHAE